MKHMIEHINKLSAFLKKHYPTAPEIITIKSNKTFNYLMFNHIKTKGKNKGKCGYGWATMRARWCTSQLKTYEIEKFCKSLGDDCINYIGIAADEPKRIAYETIIFKTADKQKHTITKSYPLVDLAITEAQALQYCYDNGFDWDGLYEHFDRVSCWCCPLKNLKELKKLWKYYPDLWAELKEMDALAYNQFRADYSVVQLEQKFTNEEFGVNAYKNKQKGGGL